MKGLEAYDRRHGWRGAWGHVAVTPDWEAQVGAKPPPSERRSWKAAMVEQANGAGVRLRVAGGQTGELDGADVAWARAGKGLTPGDLVFVEPLNGRLYGLRQIPAANGAIVVVEPRSGRVLAMVGGYSFSLSNFNRATQARRQPGSSFKPFVYATALENGFTPASIVLDAPISLPGANGQVWSPENDNRRSAGPQIFRNGLVYSRNQMTVRIAMKVGMKKIRDKAIQAGVVNDMAPVLAMALGAGETTPFRLTGAYAAFANGGRKIEPHLIEAAEGRKGEMLIRADKRECPRCDLPFDGSESPRIPPQGQQIMDPVTAYQMAAMLQGVTQQGTAAAVSAAFPNVPIAGKTGTTNDYRDAWFVGFTPDLVVGVFVGFDNHQSLGEGEQGSRVAVPIFIDFMQGALKGMPVHDFVAPKTAKFAQVGRHREAFFPGTEPKPRPAPVDGGSPAAVSGPRPYNQAFPGGKIPGDPASSPPPPPPKKAPQDLNGLY